MKLSVIVPAYNEAKRNIIQTLDDYYKRLRKEFGKDFEIGIIPNNCSDNTNKIVYNWIKNGHPQAWIHNMKGYTGKGGAVMRGFDIAKGDYIAFVDADNATTVEEFYKCYKAIKMNDGAIASRRIYGSEISPPRRWTQNLSSWLFNFVTNFLFRLGFRDTQCGCKIFSKECAKFLEKNYTEPGWNFDVNLLYLCKMNGYNITEHPIKWTDTAGGKVSTWEGIKAVLGLFKYRVKSL